MLAIHRLHAPDATVAIYTAGLLAAQTVFNLIWGWLADRNGHKLVLTMGIGIMALDAIIALLIPSAMLFTVVFVLLGAGQSAYTLSRLAIVLEFAPSERRPTYVGLASLALAPLALIGPLLGGVLIDRVRFGPTFVGFAIAGVVSTLLLVVRVREPRSQRAGRGGMVAADTALANTEYTEGRVLEIAMAKTIHGTDKDGGDPSN